ncbi:uncharacterized protein LOC133784027 [Humulus lupulus]|uniref:uncharacterized protein LOC133784027 n=1 Tax=Humulus lupulus TaxID=3486 RepID=UPI002B40A934|nr:uncharacterized protein LOC133784027 [Humulus lupulus]
MNIIMFTQTLLALLVCIELFSAHARILQDNNDVARGDQIRRTFEMIIRSYDGRRRAMNPPPPPPYSSPPKKQLTADPHTMPYIHYYYKSPPPPSKKETLSSTYDMANGVGKRSPPQPPRGAKQIVYDSSFQY